ncbi:unnamed protein product [Caenorhabditis auriculariae]|uniref:Uncharacterized protein n=1 Tax=Caenorhabditis auriculariae TaxID=2777116 RepID=A0A8S1HK75_9PELO|nr:unnamed protein product [Caenorhabditis auriculariae]
MALSPEAGDAEAVQKTPSQKQSSNPRTTVSPKRSTRKKLSGEKLPNAVRSSPRPQNSAVYGVRKTDDEDNQSAFDFVTDCMSMMSMMTSTQWLTIVPMHFLIDGGFAYLTATILNAVIFVLPLLALEIFIGQMTQKSPVGAFQSYGVFFTGIGVGLMVFTCLQHVLQVFELGVFLRHLFKLSSYGLNSVADCSFDIPSNQQCVDIHETNGSYHSPLVYFQSSVARNASFSSPTGIYIFVSILVFNMILLQMPIKWFKVLMSVLLVLSGVLLPIVAFANSIGIHSWAMEVALQASSYYCFSQSKMWTVSFRSALLCLRLTGYGVSSLASFRPKNSRFYELSAACVGYVVFGILVSSLIPNDIHASPKENHHFHYMSRFHIYDQSIAMPTVKIPEVHAVHRIADFRLVLFNILYLVMQFSSNLGGLISLKALARDYAALKTYITYSFVALFAVLFYALVPFSSIQTSSIGLVSSTVVTFYTFLSLLVFVFLYGVIHLLKDLTRIYSEPEGFIRYFTVFSPINRFTWREVVPFMLCIFLVIETFEIGRRAHKNRIYIVPASIVGLMMAIPLFFILLVFWYYRIQTVEKELQPLLFPSKAHHMYDPSPLFKAKRRKGTKEQILPPPLPVSKESTMMILAESNLTMSMMTSEQPPTSVSRTMGFRSKTNSEARRALALMLELFGDVPTATLRFALVFGLVWNIIYVRILFSTSFLESKKTFYVLLVIYEVVALMLFSAVPWALWRRAFVFPSASICVCMDCIIGLNVLLYMRMLAIHRLRWSFLINYFYRKYDKGPNYRVVPGASITIVALLTASRYAHFLIDRFIGSGTAVSVFYNGTKVARLFLACVVTVALVRESCILQSPDDEERRNELFMIDYMALKQSIPITFYTMIALGYYESRDYFHNQFVEAAIVILYPYVISLSFLWTQPSLQRQLAVMFSRKRPKLSAIYVADENSDHAVRVHIKPLDVASLDVIP